MTKSYGRYELVNKLAETSVEALWSGRDSVLARSVFVKVAASSLSNEQRALWSANACGEARALANVSDPNIVMLLDIDEENPCRYLVFEHVDGPTFAERIACGPYTLAVAAVIAHELAGACNAFEAAKIAARIRPECVFFGGATFSKVINLLDSLEPNPQTGKAARALATMAGSLLHAVTGIQDETSGLAAVPAHVRPIFERALLSEGVDPYPHADAFANALSEAAKVDAPSTLSPAPKRAAPLRWQNILIAVAFIALVLLVLRARRALKRTPLDQLRAEVVRHFAPKVEPTVPTTPRGR